MRARPQGSPLASLSQLSCTPLERHARSSGLAEEIDLRLDAAARAALHVLDEVAGDPPGARLERGVGGIARLGVRDDAALGAIELESRRHVAALEDERAGIHLRRRRRHGEGGGASDDQRQDAHVHRMIGLGASLK